ncbi:Protein BZZ1 [Recurvomyces mirabilis]|uniref:Protein BZZ1 n=1 Tax=Recurvomyces mirabilis TaxID=574656 RepID=A0AAE0TU51_9PEZI|nr:Protein BZZ1 [Recurvomyces mirabilis]KAK5151650.1 Protein BZZ1 [Recurvomyces mirabilis]
MAEIDIAPNFGAELKDGFKSANAWVSNGIAWLDDVQQFYRERSGIEKEYAQKLNALAKKYFEKKAKKSSSLSVGDNPSVTPGSLECASMTTWTVQLTTLEQRAAEHERFSTLLVNSLAVPLQTLAQRYEDLRKQHAEYAAKLEKERDGVYGDLKKTKGKYDSVCQDVENKRKKIENSFDHGKTKAQGAYAQQQSDMRNMKNTYLIAINVTNKQKERYYHEYVPEILDSVSEAKTATLNKIWSTAAAIETETLTRSTQLLNHLSNEIPRNNPVLDSMMYVRHNAIQWSDPPDFGFEPSPVWLDDDSMAADPASKTFLMNILTKSKGSLGALKRETEAKRKEVEGAKRVRQAIREGKDKRDELEVVRMQFYHREALHAAESRMISAEVEVSTITSAVGDISVGARNHAFKNETFRLPTNCDLCGDRIWGLSAKGMSCNDCGYTCHLKCELKVPADCPGELNKEQRKAAKAERQSSAQAAVTAPTDGESNGGAGHRGSGAGLQRSDTIGSMNTLSSGYAASANRSVSGTGVPATETGRGHKVPPPLSGGRTTTYSSRNGSLPEGKMLYTYSANGAGELSVAEGTTFSLLEPDDGSGWIRIKPTGFGAVGEGLVPASYAEVSPPSPPLKSAGMGSGSGSRPERPTSLATSTSNLSLTGSLDSTSGGSLKQKKIGPVVAPRRGAKKAAPLPATPSSPFGNGGGGGGEKMVEALYAYPGSGPGETSMQGGEQMVLILPDQGDGWVEVESRGGRGVVPASWVREV